MTKFQLENVDIDNMLRPEHLEAPYKTFMQLQAEDAVHWNPQVKGWMISRYDDVAELLQDSRLSSAVPFGYLIAREMSDEERAAMNFIRPYVEMSLLNMDPPDQKRQRTILGRAFTTRKLRQLQGWVEQIVNDMVDKLQPLGKFELVHEFAFPMLFRVIFTMLGIPKTHFAEASELFHEGSVLVIKFNSMFRPTGEDLVRFASNLRTTEEFLRPIVEEKRKNPTDDVISMMVKAEKDGELSEKEIYVLCSQLVFAAHETTASAIATGMFTLLRYPDQVEHVMSNPEHLDLAVEEILRYGAPGQMRPRIAREDIEFRGTHIQKGQRVFLMLAAANFDAEHFACPEQLNLSRPKKDHIMTFGHGIHYCMGAALARLELGIVFPTLFRRLPGLRLASSEVTWRPNFLLRGLAGLPLVFDPPTSV